MRCVMTPRKYHLSDFATQADPTSQSTLAGVPWKLSREAANLSWSGLIESAIKTIESLELTQETTDFKICLHSIFFVEHC